MLLEGALQAIAEKVTVAVETPDPLSRRLRLRPPPELTPVSGKLALPEILTATETVGGKTIGVALDLLLKQVRFADVDPKKDGTLGGMPIAPPAYSPTGIPVKVTDLLMTTDAAGTGVPGLLGKLTGTVNIDGLLQDVTKTVTYDGQVKVSVTVTDTHNPVTGQVAFSGGFTVTDGVASTGYVPTLPADFTLRFPMPPLVPFLRLPPPTTPYVVSVAVTVKAIGKAPDPDREATVTLPPIPVQIPQVPIPVVVALFTDRDYSGRVLVVVPPNSPVPGLQNVGAAFDPAIGLLNALFPKHPLLAFLRSPAWLALSRLAKTQQGVRFAMENAIHDLSQYEFDPLPARLTAEDSISSLIVVGPPGVTVGLNEERTRPDNTASASPILVPLKNGVVAIPNLADLDPATGHPRLEPYSDPINDWGHPGPWNDRLSAVWFQ